MQSQQSGSGGINDATNPQTYQLHYATIHFQDSVSVSTEENAFSEYSSISRIEGASHTPAAQPLYSTVTMPVDKQIDPTV